MATIHMTRPPISVVVCARNEELWLEDCLRALHRQVLKPEIIVVDGHSKDKTREIAKKFADKIVLDHGCGIADARNVGWQAARSDIIAYCDADARPPPDWTANILKEMEGAIAVSGPLNAYDGGLRQKLGFKVWAEILPLSMALFGFGNIWGANMAFRKSVLEREPFKSKFCEDFEIGIRMRRIGKVRFAGVIRLDASTRRFEKSFIRTCLRFYMPAAIRVIFFKNYEQTGYF